MMTTTLIMQRSCLVVACLLVVLGSAGAQGSSSPASSNVTLRLATDLDHTEQYPASSCEFRRLAFTESDSARRGVYYWMAAYEAYQAKHWNTVITLLDRAEDESRDLVEHSLLLRARVAAKTDKHDETIFYLKSVVDSQASADERLYAARRLAEAQVRKGKPTEARATLQQSPGNNEQGVLAVDLYQRGHDKSPMLGGVLGIIPGMGYVYAGEYANALRSLILNGVFIFGMVDTAQDDQWGAFAVISFFEATWYSGSIYGGIDATQRYNQERRTACVDGIMGNADFAPDFKQLPILSLKFTF